MSLYRTSKFDLIFTSDKDSTKNGKCHVNLPHKQKFKHPKSNIEQTDSIIRKTLIPLFQKWKVDFNFIKNEVYHNEKS